MTFAKRVFSLAAIYGLLVLLPQYFLETRFGHDNPPPISHPEFYYGFIGVAVAFQVVFLVIARDPLRYRSLMIPSVLEKAGFGVPVVLLFLQHRAPAMIFGAGMVDLSLGVLFALAYVRTGSVAA